MLNIIAVDCDCDFLQSLNNDLNKMGFKCTLTSIPKLAVELYKMNIYDLIIIGHQLPKVDGVNLMNELTAYDSRLKAIIITNDDHPFADDSYKHRSNIITVMEKPIKFFVLKTILSRLKEMILKKMRCFI